MGFPAKKAATYQDILDAPPNLVAEILDGDLSLQPRPAPPHAFAASGLGSDVFGLFQRGRGGPGGWWIVNEPEVHLGRNVLVPDVAGWRRERMPVFPDGSCWFDLAPDWVCEILSPSTRRIDQVYKARIYARAGIPWLWFVDPVARMVEVRRLDDGHWVVHETADDDSGTVRLPPFDAVDLTPGDWFPPLPDGEAGR